jgi:hypothetical protein
MNKFLILNLHINVVLLQWDSDAKNAGYYATLAPTFVIL